VVYENRMSAQVSENKGLKKSSGIAESAVLNLPEHEGSANGGRAARRRRRHMRIAARKVEVGKEIAVSGSSADRVYISGCATIGAVHQVVSTPGRKEPEPNLA